MSMFWKAYEFREIEKLVWQTLPLPAHFGTGLLSVSTWGCGGYEIVLEQL